jgi:hypothetical protein
MSCYPGKTQMKKRKSLVILLAMQNEKKITLNEAKIVEEVQHWATE